MQDSIVVKGARQHNLKNISITIPRNQLVVVTGLSGSGKSSLVFDTIYAEGQRRYVESLSAYARQFLGVMEKPDVDLIEGLSPAISIDQKSGSHNPRSTVGTVTEIYDYLRVLFARIGTPHCPTCSIPLKAQNPQDIVKEVQKLPNNSKILLLAPLIRDRKGTHEAAFKLAKKRGFVRVRVNGDLYDLDAIPDLDKNKRHSIEIVVDRLVIEDSLNPVRISDSVEACLKLGEGLMFVILLPEQKGGEEKTLVFSERFACPQCEFSFGSVEPRMFSFNSPQGACVTCHGLGTLLTVDPDLIVPNARLSLSEGAIIPWSRSDTSNSWYGKMLKALSQKYKFSLDEPIKDLGKEVINILLYGDKEGTTISTSYVSMTGNEREYDFTYEGVIPNLERRYRETNSDYVRKEIEKFMRIRTCTSCFGKRLKSEILAITVQNNSISDITDWSVEELKTWLLAAEKAFTPTEAIIAESLLKEIRTRLSFLETVGLTYLTLSRAANTLSGGESQRIRLATQIGSKLTGVLYVLDEPSIGLHPRDNEKLISTLKDLQKIGNTIIVVEHDRDMMLAADYLIDIGPGAGEHGGNVVSAGLPKDVVNDPNSPTGQYLSGKKEISLPNKRKTFDPAKHKKLLIKKATHHNLKNIDVTIPLQRFVCLTGVSGSGKSTLLNKILFPALAAHLYKSKNEVGKHGGIEGLQHLDKVINIDQSPIGRTPRSNPATYTGVFNYIRKVFSSLPEANTRGYREGHFSFNVKGGRCETCKGDGLIKIEMHFLPDVYVTCEDCHGDRYRKEILDIRYKGKHISEVLNMTVEEALEFFNNVPNIKSRLQKLHDVGLSYIKLGQSAPTLSGGEAQRVKLSSELSRRPTGKTLYIFDEPTTGLHFDDIKKLLGVLFQLVETGNSVVVIEHNMEVIKCADHIIDLGPEGGDKGGNIVAEGSPETVAKTKGSYTGRFLKELLK